jgi:hypothetical protein
VLFALLEVAGASNTGVSLDDILSQLLNDDFHAMLEKGVGKACRTPAELMAALGIDTVPSEKASLRFQKAFSLLHSKNEAIFLNLGTKSPHHAMARAVLVLAVLYGKWRGITSDLGFEYISRNAGAELWNMPVTKLCDEWLKPGLKWSEALYPIFEDLIVNQHDRIMYEKRRLDSCWLHRADGRVIKDQDYSPRWRASRHSNAVTIMQDLGLLNIDKSDRIKTTSRGEYVLQRVMSEPIK